MTGNTLYLSLSKHKIMCCEVAENDGSFLTQRIFDVGYNQAPLKVLTEGLHSISTGHTEVYCTLKYPFFVLIPESLFEESNAADYLMDADLKGKKVVWDNITRNQIICVYAVEQDVYDKLVLKYPNGIIRHYAAVMIDHSLKTASKANATVVAIDFENEEFYMSICKGNDLLLCNKFEFKSPEDVLYFVLYSLEQFQLKPEMAKVYLSGLVENNMASVILLKEYFADVFSNEANSIAATEFKFQSVLLHQHECV